jgi:hypothetical protein
MQLEPIHPVKPRYSVLLLGLLALLAVSRSLRSEPMPMTILARTMAPVTLGSGPVVVPLAPAGSKSLAAGLAGMPAGRRLYLLVRGLTATEQPGVLYSVYLDLPVGVAPGQNDPRRVGIIQFYNARPPGAVDAPDAGSAVGADAGRVFFSFDLTPVVRDLRRRGQLTDQTTLTLIAEGSPAQAAKVEIGSLELVEQ